MHRRNTVPIAIVLVKGFAQLRRKHFAGRVRVRLVQRRRYMGGSELANGLPDGKRLRKNDAIAVAILLEGDIAAERLCW